MHCQSYWNTARRQEVLFQLCTLQVVIAPPEEQADAVSVVLDVIVTLPDDTDSQTLEEFEVRHKSCIMTI